MDEDEEDEEDEDEDDDEIEEIEDVEPGEADDEETGPSQEVSETDERSNSPQVIGTVPGTAAISSRSPNKRKAPLEMREIEEVVSDDDEDEDEDSDDDVEEVKDDDDSDIMEVEAEDPLKKNQQTPNVVTIDDVKTLQKLAAANSVKSKSGETGDGDKVTLIDTNSILAGKGTSGVTITPAKPKTGLFPEAAKLPSGITISQVILLKKVECLGLECKVRSFFPSPDVQQEQQQWFQQRRGRRVRFRLRSERPAKRPQPYRRHLRC